jgi:hypothetical protein
MTSSIQLPFFQKSSIRKLQFVVSELLVSLMSAPDLPIGDANDFPGLSPSDPLGHHAQSHFLHLHRPLPTNTYHGSHVSSA